MPREWNTPFREPWNPVIHNLLKAIDNHVQAYFRTQDPWHLEKAQDLRIYVNDLKQKILNTENNESI